jgi:hypothetical protein
MFLPHTDNDLPNYMALQKYWVFGLCPSSGFFENPIFLCVIHHRRNPIVSTWRYIAVECHTHLFYVCMLHATSIWSINSKKGKAALCLINFATRHEDVWGWRYSSTVIELGTAWRRQLHDLTALLKRIEPPVPIIQGVSKLNGKTLGSDSSYREKKKSVWQHGSGNA